MNLKKLIVSGFKSFADKVTLNFDDGITGIVGPNGSGKSNVIDAVRWVMGEQNAKYLRGQVATDIIFAGSDKRKQLGMAEVTLVFDNAVPGPFCPPEYRHEPEISLTRRLYIDGEREYLINRKPCRLKDIVNFFAVTGLGGRSYSMIQQGQVDRILNAKPEDVREILEEAAGTLVFKNRRAAALKKLEGTNENLKRIEDIVAELAKQLDTLESQVEKAKKWQELTAGLREKELALFAHNYARITESLKTLQTEHDAETDKEVELMAQLSHWEARQEELQSILSESDPELDEIREQVSSIREQIVRKESAITAALGVVDQGKRRLGEIEQELGESEDNLKALEEQVSIANERASAAHTDKEKLQSELDAYQDEVDRVNESQQVFQTRLDEMEDQIRNLDHLLESNGLRCEAIERDRKRLTQDAERHQERMQLLQQEISKVAQQLAVVQEKVNHQESGLSEELTMKAEYETQQQSLQSDLREKKAEQDQLKEEFFTTKARLNSLQELANEVGNVGALAQKLQERGDDAAIVGVLGEIVHFNDAGKELPTVLQSAIEKWADRLVVNDMQSLKTLTTIVQTEGFSSIPVALLTENHAVDQDAIERWAQQYGLKAIVDYFDINTQLYRDDVSALLRRQFVVESDDSSVVAQMPAGVMVFTQQGLIINGSGDYMICSTSGAGSLTRRTQIETLTTQLGQHEERLSLLKGAIADLEAEQQTLQQDMKALEEIIQSKNKDVFGVLSELQALKQQHEHKNEMLNEVSTQLRQANDMSQAYKRELEELGKGRITLGLERESLERELENLRTDSGSVLDESEEVRRIFENKRLDLAKFEARSQAQQENLAQTRDQLERLRQTLGRRQEERDRIHQEMQAAQENEGKFKDEIQELIERREAFEETLNKKKEEHSEILEEMQVVESRLKESHKKQVEMQETKTKRTLGLEKMRFEMQNIEEQSRERYHLEIASYEFERDPDFEIEKTSREIHRLRDKIDGMGAINMMAIEEYDKLQERYTFITRQREEVIGSIRLLEDAIMEIEDTAREKFLTTFAVINQNFTELFPILFPSGEAKLALTNEEDPLNAGVDILVRLPGKKQQSMNLFSGGEKALTAISLIFALLKTKPTPFCFLDEVDAPLDEANVGRYNRVLEALSDRFQFIVITHNRRTMEVLDQLYGVTMQEGGVSKVVGVDMKKDIPAHLQKAFKQEKKPAETREVAGASAQQ